MRYPIMCYPYLERWGAALMVSRAALRGLIPTRLLFLDCYSNAITPNDSSENGIKIRLRVWGSEL